MALSNKFKLIFNFFLILNYFKLSDSTSPKKCFKAAVYEHITIEDPKNEPLKILNNNLVIYERVLKRASFVDTKLIVFPEYGLFPLILKKEEIIKNGIASIIPKLNVNYCQIYKEKLKNITESNYSDIQKSEEMIKLDKETEAINDKFLNNIALLRKISCLAAENKIYIVINLIELDTRENYEKSKIERQSEKSNLEEDLKLSSSSELDTLKLSDQIINEKLINQLNKINEEKAEETTGNKLIDNYFLFNTNLIFDNNGKLIAKYRKFNLYGESPTIKRPNLEIQSIDTEFGRIGLAICFDLIHEQPLKSLVEDKKIDHLVFSTKWMDQFPSLNALSFHSSVAVKYKINILSSNIRNLTNGSFGSGIFNGKNGVRIQTKFDNHDRLLIADLPIGNPNDDNDTINENVDLNTFEYSNLDTLDVINNPEINYEKENCNHFEPLRIAEETYQEFSYFFRQNTFLSDYRKSQTPLNLFKTKRLENTEGKLNICDKDVCCELEYRMNKKFNFASDNYLLVAISRKHQSTEPSLSWYEESCNLVSYHQSKSEYKLISATHFDKLILRGKFNTTDIFPNVVSSALYLIPKHRWNFRQIYNESEISFENLKRPISFVNLYGRNFLKDKI